MIRVLHIVGSLERAGIETFLMNIYRNIDRSKIQFDFAIYNEPTEGGYASEVKKLGGKIYFIPTKSESLFKCFSTIKRIVKENNYSIVWRHTDTCVGGIDLLPAYWGGAKKRILHSHCAEQLGIIRYLHFLLRPLCNIISTHKVACGEKAALWMFGNKEYRIIPNGIDTEIFKYNESIRNEYRKKLGLEDKIILGDIGRFEKQKNFAFLIEIFYSYLKQHENAVLILVGKGSLETECKEIVEKYGISDKVLFLGERNDVPQLLQAMDVFVMPSLFEGFPVVLVEAQTAGLPCVISDTISNETDIIGETKYVSLDCGVDKWCDAINDKIGIRKKDGYLQVAEKGYDVIQNAKIIESFLIDGFE
ncbi:glycosyltransferase family 1 protein [Butyrivibrio sp. AE2032]|uniref:glycosyltransferase family 1 protein n=1 Tax=Butyrivibrio sp. AE2032 TaxID=1458463 RepID=UPI00054D1B6C|nr:glycosyltransferase family 1 protein [Butyrivibrio sp. AE2032]